MKERLYTATLMGAITAGGSSMGCRSEIISPEGYNLDFEETTIPCGDIEFFTPYDKEHYCSDKDDGDVVTIDAFYDTSVGTRQKITDAVKCVLGPSVLCGSKCRVPIRMLS